MIPDKAIQEITNRIDIVDILGSYIKLKKRGANFLGLCPFHNEKTPSFTVSPAKSIYKCFGCGKSGNTITFLMEHEKYSYADALRFLAVKYQIEIEETGYVQEKNDASALHILNQFAAEYFLGRCSDAKEYFAERKINYKAVMEFMLGFDDGGLVKAALAKQFSIDMLRKAGLATEKENDSYRGRVIFPVHNNIGKVIGFGARKLQETDFGPKYINTPENDSYNKSKVLYGIFFAAKEISTKDECIMVEGYTDVISLHQGNIKNVVSSSGTSLTIGQLRTIKKYTTNLSIIYDGDEAGHKAALRGLDLALDEGIRVKGVLLPAGHDPDSYINEVGPEKFIKFIQEEKKDLVYIQAELLLHGNTDPAKRSEAINIIAQSIAKLDRPEDFSLRQDYIRRCSQLLDVDESGMITLVKQLAGEEINNVAPVTLTADDCVSEKALVKALLEHGTKKWEDKTVGKHIYDEVESNELFGLMDDQNCISIIQEYGELLASGQQPDSNHFLYHENPVISNAVVSILQEKNILSQNWELRTLKVERYIQEVATALSYLLLRKVKKLLKQNQNELRVEKDIEVQTQMVQTHRYLKDLEIRYSSEIGAVIVPLK